VAYAESEEEGSIEWLASRMVSRTERALPAWALVEIWRSKGLVPVGPAASSEETTRIGLTLTATRSSKECYSTMRAPRGHACARCLSEPTAAMMRHAVMSNFAPGIALVGRCWLLAEAEHVDIATAELSTYARAKIAARAGLASAIAVPVASVATGEVTAVVIVYFRDRLDAAAGEATLAAMLGVALGDSPRSPRASPLAASSPDDPPSPSDAVASVSLSPDNQRLAAKLGRGRRTAKTLYPCPICFATVEKAVKIEACAHVACRDCLARWTILSRDCPACGGFVGEVTPDPSLDALIHQSLNHH